MQFTEQTVRRRRFVETMAVASAGLLLPATAARGQAPAGLQPLNRFPRMMQEYLVAQVREAHSRSVDAKFHLVNRADAEAYVANVRGKIRECFGPHPPQTPLKPRVTGVVERDTYRIEKVVFESRPNFPVTANLYLPKSTVPVPGVVGTCGHSSNGKAAEAYQSFAQGLARLGYACLIYDPIGQGERLQYPDAQLKSQIGVGVREHIQSGNQQFLVGENLAMWRAWDGIRTLDYLLTRPEIDPQHVGVTGNSGGGTMTTWLCGVESRWTMAAPACFVTTFLHNAENELPADTEQCPPRVLSLGLEHEDFLAALAPKPIVILAKERDFFDVRGSEEAYGRLKHLYTLLGYPDNISLHIGPTEHGYSIENREAMYAWFNRATKSSAGAQEPTIELETDATLQCTESGQVAEWHPATVADFTREKALALRASRGALRGAALQAAVRDVLKLPPQLAKQPPHYRILRSFGNRQLPLKYATAYAVETEPGIQAISYLLAGQRHDARPPRQGERAQLYVAHRSSDQELRQEAWLRDLLKQDLPIFSCDVRGIGESLPNTCGIDSFDDAYGCDYFYAAHGIMLDRPYAGQKTLDVLRVIHWLDSLGYSQIELIGLGWGALIGTFAALLSPQVVQLSIKDRLQTFHDLAVDPLYDMPLAYLPPGILQHFDLDDCDAELGASKLRVLPAAG